MCFRARPRTYTLICLCRYMTIQKYTYNSVGQYQLQLDEVDIVVYCEGSFAQDEFCPEPTPDEDCDTLVPR